MKKILGVNPDLIFDEKVVIVGSSVSLAGSEFGEEIDQFDEVVRFNRAPTMGFESDIGSKTTLRVVNNHVFNNNDVQNEGYTGQPSNFVRDLRNSKILYVAPDIVPWLHRSENTHFSNEVFLFDYRVIKGFKKELNIDFPKQLTVGGVFVGLCVLAGVRPSLIGFDFVSGPRTHYWESRPPFPSEVHDITAEQKWFLRLKSEDKIKIIKQ